MQYRDNINLTWVNGRKLGSITQNGSTTIDAPWVCLFRRILDYAIGEMITMYNDFFIDAAEKIFRDLQLKYNFFIKKQGSFLTYSNCSVAFTIYFERQFEIYINIHIQSKDLRLVDIMKWLNYPEQDIITVKNNQVHDQPGILRVLYALERIMQGLLANFEKFQADLPLILKKQELCEKQAVILEQLERAWTKKEYATYYQIYHSNQNILSSAVKFPLLSKRAEYAKKRGVD